MKAEKRVNIIMQELDSKAASIPSYLEDDYKEAILAALTRIELEEGKEEEGAC